MKKVSDVRASMGLGLAAVSVLVDVATDECRGETSARPRLLERVVRGAGSALLMAGLQVYPSRVAS